MKPLKLITLFVAMMVCSSQANAEILHGLKTMKDHPFITMGAIGVAGAIYAHNCIDDKNKASKCNLHPGDDGDFIMGNGVDSSGELVPEKGDSKKLRKALNLERTSSGMPPDPKDCDAHHIVPSNDSRGSGGYQQAARDILKSCNIGINSADNGVFLPGKKTGSECTGPYHRAMHDEDYYIQLRDRLTNAQSKGCQNVLEELRSIKLDLINGVY